MHSNKYTIIYASVVTLIVAVLLSLASTGLKPFQERNIALEKKTNILKSVIGDEIATWDKTKIEEVFDQRVKGVVIDINGNVLEGEDAFEIDVAQEVKKDPGQRKFPLFIYTSDEGKPYYIIPLRGNGLWGPIWGFLALEPDFNTIVGATFDHKSETPGLGAEITKDWFQNQFKGEKLLDENGEYRLTVLKGKGHPEAAELYKVDGISGATITSRGVDNMLRTDYQYYSAYFEKLKSQS